MEQEKRSFQLSTGKLIPVAVLCWMGAILAIIGLLSFDYFSFEDMLLEMEIVTPSVVHGSYIFFGAIALLMVLWPGTLAFCITRVLFKRPGFTVLSGTADVCAKVVKILRYVLIGYFVFRAIRYTIVCMKEDLVVYLLMAMFLYEGLFGVGFYFFLQLLINFFSSAADTLASLQHVLYSGKPEYSSSHVSVCRMLIFLAFPGIGLAIYLLLYPFVGIMCAISLVLTAISNLWLSILLKSFQTRISNAVYQLEKERKAQLHLER